MQQCLFSTHLSLLGPSNTFGHKLKLILVDWVGEKWFTTLLDIKSRKLNMALLKGILRVQQWSLDTNRRPVGPLVTFLLADLHKFPSSKKPKSID